VPGSADEPGEDEVPIEGGQCATFRSVVARANYLAHDRPDIQYAVKELCRKMSRPTRRDWHKLKKVCRYLRGRPRLIQRKIPIQPGVVEVYVDSDWAGCKTTRRSTSGGAMYAYGMCLKTWSVTQGGITRSSGEAELYAAVKGMAEGLGMQSMAKELGIDMKVVVYTDSNACRGTCGRKGLGRMKHLEVEALWAQQVVRRGRVQLQRVPTGENIADLMTKHLVRNRIDQLLCMMGYVEG